MTIIRPDRSQAFLTKVLVAVFGACLIALASLVGSYVHLLNLKHSLSDLTVQAQEVKTQSSELKDKTFAMLNGDKLGELALARGLIQDRAPEYLTTNSQWLTAASRF